MIKGNLRVAETNYVLKMYFKNEEGKTTSMSIRNIKTSLPAADVTAAMDAIVNSQAFMSSGGKLVAKAKAEIVKTDKTPIETAF